MSLYITELDMRFPSNQVALCDKIGCESSAVSVLWSSPNDPECFVCVPCGDRAVKFNKLPNPRPVMR
jgi:hypothetical protein